MDKPSNVAEKLNADKIEKAKQLLKSYLTVNPELVDKLKTAIPQVDTDKIVDQLVRLFYQECKKNQDGIDFVFVPEQIIPFVQNLKIEPINSNSFNESLYKEPVSNSPDRDHIKVMHQSNEIGLQPELSDHDLKHPVHENKNSINSTISLLKLLGSLDNENLQKLLNLVQPQLDNPKNTTNNAKSNNSDNSHLAETVARQAAIIERQQRQIEQLLTENSKLQKEVDALKIKQLEEEIAKLKLQQSAARPSSPSSRSSIFESATPAPRK